MDHLLSDGATVVLLGLAADTTSIIRALNRDCGTAPLLFAEKRPFGFPLFLRYRFVRCLMPQNEYYTLHSVLDMAAPQHEVRTILVPCTSQFEKYVSDNPGIFESEYIIRTRAELCALLPSLCRRRHASPVRRSQT